MMDLLLDWKDQASWGRCCALICLVQALVAYYSGKPESTQALWLGAGFGAYMPSKLPEIVATFKGWKP